MAAFSTHAVDAVVVVTYLAVTFIAGAFAHRFWRSDHQDEESYYLAGRRIPSWVNGTSYAVTAINADVAPLYCGMAVVVGLPVAWFFLSRFSLAWMLVAMLFAVRWRQLGIRTGPEFYALRFGGRGAKLVRVYTALFAVAINMVPWIGAGLLGAHMILSPILGVDTKLITVLCVVPPVLIYVWISGFAGVLMTDVLQTLVIIGASALLLYFVQTDLNGPTGVAVAIEQSHPHEHGEILSALPVPGHEILGPLVVLAWLIVPTIGRGGSVDLEGQRMFSCRSSREAAKMLVWGQCVMFAMLLLLTLPVLGMLSRHPELYHASRSDREQVYGQMLAEFMPTGLLGLAVAGILASVMSTISSHLNYGAQTIVNDVLRQLAPESRLLDSNSAACLWIGRLVTLLILLCGVSVMFAADSLFRIATVIAGMFASMAAFFWAQWWWWRINLWSWLAAMIGGPAIYILLATVLPKWPWWQLQLAQSAAAADTLAMFHAIIAIGLSTCIWVSVALLTAPETDETLKRFYLHAKPLGAWRRVHRMLSSEELATLPMVSGWNLLFGGAAVAVLGASWVTLGVLGVSQLAVGRIAVAAPLLLAALLGGLVFRRAFDWHMTRMQAD